MKTETTERKGGQAPGQYCCECSDCGLFYMGDKRSWQCADCAYANPLVDREHEINRVFEKALSYTSERVESEIDTCISELEEIISVLEELGKVMSASMIAKAVELLK